MAIPQKIIKFLENNKIKYELISHRTVYTAYDKAATLKVKPKIIGKTLVLKMDKELAIALIPGNKNLDKNKFKKVVNDWRKKKKEKPAKNIDFVSEKLMKNKFKGLKIGAVPPFGDIWKIPTFIDKGLLKEKNIFVNSGVYENSFKISPKIFEKLEVVIGNFSKAKK
jgi:Ala-tRNA(Pro) deacylase